MKPGKGTTSLSFKDPHIEACYEGFLRRARIKRLVFVGILTIILNTMYDMPEWILAVFCPNKTADANMEPSKYTPLSVEPSLMQRRRRHAVSSVLLPMDIIEVVLQMSLLFSGFIPLVKMHTEGFVVSITLVTALLASVRPSIILWFTQPDSSVPKEVRLHVIDVASPHMNIISTLAPSTPPCSQFRRKIVFPGFAVYVSFRC